MHERMLSRVFEPLVGLPGDYYTAWRKQGDIEERGDEQISDINERLSQDIADVREDNKLSLRQQAQEIEELEERAAKRRIEIEQDVADKKKDIWDGVLESFGDTLAEMAIKEAEMAASSWLIGKGLDFLGWEKDGYGGYQREGDGSSGGGAGDWLTVAKNLLGRDGAGEGVEQGGQSSGLWGKIGSWLGIGGGAGSTAAATTAGGGAASAAGVSAATTTAATTTSVGAGSVATGGGLLAGLGTLGTVGLALAVPAAVAAGTLFGGRAILEKTGNVIDETGYDTFLEDGAVRDTGGDVRYQFDLVERLEQSDLPEPRKQQIRNKLVDIVKERPKMIARESPVAYRERLEAWEDEVADSMGFDNAWNDEIAYRAGMRQAQQVQLSSAAQQMGHQSAMDLLEHHTQGFEDEVQDMVQHRRSTSRGGGAASGSEYAEVVVNVVVEENGRQRRKEQQRELVKLKRQGVVD